MEDEIISELPTEKATHVGTLDYATPGAQQEAQPKQEASTWADALVPDASWVDLSWLPGTGDAIGTVGGAVAEAVGEVVGGIIGGLLEGIS